MGSEGKNVVSYKRKEKTMESNGEHPIGYFLAGLGLGAIVALLFAPRSGERTREYIRDRATEGRDYLKRQAGDLRKRAEETADKGKEFVEQGRETIRDAVDSAKQAYREETQKM
jgi:gas vesicle protein